MRKPAPPRPAHLPLTQDTADAMVFALPDDDGDHFLTAPSLPIRLRRKRWMFRRVYGYWPST